jgi:hypothetical protein
MDANTYEVITRVSQHVSSKVSEYRSAPDLKGQALLYRETQIRRQKDDKCPQAESLLNKPLVNEYGTPTIATVTDGSFEKSSSMMSCDLWGQPKPH